MSRAHKIRESLDAKLNKWEKHASALEVHLTEGKDKAMDRLEAQKRNFTEVLHKFKTEVDKSKTVAEDAKEAILHKVEHLRVQLALGRAETKDVYREQKKKIKDAISSLEASIDRRLDATSDAATEKLIKEADALDAEFEALDVRSEKEKSKLQAQFEEKKTELADKIQAFKKDLAHKKTLAKEKAGTFEKELSDGLSHIKKAFSDLFS